MMPNRLYKGRVLKPWIGFGGYHMVTLARVGHRRCNEAVHVLMLLTFVGPRPEGAVCRHLNGDPTDNRIVNLRWGTRLENAADAGMHGVLRRGESSATSKLKEADIPRIREMRAGGMSYPKIGLRLGVSGCTIRDVVLGITWVHVK
jgi:hypothetical protein